MPATKNLPDTWTFPLWLRPLLSSHTDRAAGGTAPENKYVARELQEAGFGTLLLDLLTTEEEQLDLVTREKRFDIPLLADRLVHVTTWLRQQESTRDLGIGYFGASTGAAAALAAAADHPSWIKAVVSRGGRPDLAGARLDRVIAPTLLIVGEQDEVVIKLNQEALQHLPGTKDLKVVPGATHLFEEPGALELVSSLARDWFGRFVEAPKSKK